MKNIMNYRIFIFIGFALFQSCSSMNSLDAITKKIQKVETGLVPPVYIEGESKWTIEERMEHYGVPGVSIAVINDGRIEYLKSYGVMNKESKAPVTTKTLFQAASISKPVSAYAALRMVEQNKLILDEDIRIYLKSWKLPENKFTKEKKVTLRNILNHSGGITVHGFLGYSSGLAVPTLIDVLNGEKPANSGPITVDKIPGESFRYSGGGFTILQQMMMDIEGKPFPIIMEDLVLEPLIMKNSTYNQPLNISNLERAATGYLPNGEMVTGGSHTYPEMAPAGLWTTAEDLAKFTVNILNTVKGGEPLALSAPLTNQMLTPGNDNFIGLGFFIDDMKGDQYFSHNGWNEGFTSNLIAHKYKGYGVVVLTNSNHPQFMAEVLRSVALIYSWDNFIPVYSKMKLENNLRKEIMGRYLINGNEIVEVYENLDQLYIKQFGKEPLELIKVSDSNFVTREEDRFIRFTAKVGNIKANMKTIDPADGSLISFGVRMNNKEIIPVETLIAGDFDKAVEQYQNLMIADPNNPIVDENNINAAGYSLLNAGNIRDAQALFKVNTILYPHSSNVYDSYAEACFKIGNIDLAIENYRKSLNLDPLNNNAERMILELSKMK